MTMRKSFDQALLALCVFVMATATRAHDPKTVLAKLAIALSVAGLVASPWYIRNWILLGCPIYPPPPALLRFFHPRYLPPETSQRLLNVIWKEGEGLSRSLLSFLLLPFNLTYHPANFMNGAGGIGLAPLGLAPFGLLHSRNNRFAWFLALFVSTLVVATSVAYGIFMLFSINKEDLRATLSPSFENRRKQEKIPFLDSFDYLNREPSVERVLVLNPRVPTYYLDKGYVKPIGRWGEQSIPEGRDLQQIIGERRRLHISHILDVRLEDSGFFILGPQPGLTIVAQQRDQRVYRLD